MPELPEVETLVRQLKPGLMGRTITSVLVLREKSFRGMTETVVGKTVLGVERKQKVVVIHLTDETGLLVHLKMTGQLILIEADKKRVVGGHPTNDWVGSLPSKHTRVIINFKDSTKLFFNDQRVFGWMKVVEWKEWIQLTQSLPPDVVDEGFTQTYFGERLKRSKRAVKFVILDQAVVGGMGNIYACDALFLARLHPAKPSNQVTPEELKRLHQAMRAVIVKGIETGGASYSSFVDIAGLGGHYQDNFLVYDRQGKPCRVCGAGIEKLTLGGRGTYFCPVCQQG